MSETPAIAAEGLVRNYGKTKALTGFDLTVPAGTVYGLLGPNGAGKTTAVRVFATLLRPDGGRAQVLGHDVQLDADVVRDQIQQQAAAADHRGEHRSPGQVPARLLEVNADRRRPLARAGQQVENKQHRGQRQGDVEQLKE